VRTTIRKKAGWENGKRLDSEPITKAQVGSVAGLVNDALGEMDGQLRDQLRYQVYEYLVGVVSTNDLTKREASAIITWLKEDAEGDWTINQYAKAEVAAILERQGIDQGQAEMELPY